MQAGLFIRVYLQSIQNMMNGPFIAIYLSMLVNLMIAIVSSSSSSSSSSLCSSSSLSSSSEAREARDQHALHSAHVIQHQAQDELGFWVWVVLGTFTTFSLVIFFVWKWTNVTGNGWNFTNELTLFTYFDFRGLFCSSTSVKMIY